ncbi:hypothetical protein F5X96DRAFT_625800 [Biscogniauxia mediterranea]|nr:hypothetical protein F5X96DRAFT_625800 [Biscogniauxia mediterranea]
MRLISSSIFFFLFFFSFHKFITEKHPGCIQGFCSLRGLCLSFCLCPFCLCLSLHAFARVGPVGQLFDT